MHVYNVYDWITFDVDIGAEPKSFYVYVDRTIDGVPFYVGKGNIVRVHNPKRNAKHIAVCEKYGIKRNVVYATADEDAAYEYEKRLIVELDTLYSRGKLGTNFARGGRGPRGSVHKPVQQIDDLNNVIAEYSSIKDAQLSTNAKNVCLACQGKLKTAGGFKWRYAPGVVPEKRSPETKQRLSENHKRRRVVKMTLKFEHVKTYDSVRHAVNDNTVKYANIRRTCLNPGSTAGGFRWAYEENIHEHKFASQVTRIVEQLSSSGEHIAYFSSCLSAGKALGIHHTNINGCCNNTRKFAAGFKWRYVSKPVNIPGA